MYDLILRQAHVQDRDGKVDIAIQHGKIVKVSSRVDASGKREMRLDGKLVQPSFVNTHLHPVEALTWDRMPNVSGTYEEGLRISPALRKTFSPEDTRARVRKLLNASIRHGTTVFRATEFLAEVPILLDVAKEYEMKADIQVGPVPPANLAVDPQSREATREVMKRGCAVVDGWAPGAPDKKDYIDALFDIAKEFDVDIDMHIDYVIPDTPTWENMELVYLAQKTIEEGYQGRVTAAHVCAISSADPKLAHEAIQLVRDAGLSICTLPSQNVFMHGKSDPKSPRRGITRVREFLDAGVNIAYGTDDVRNLWNPYGNGDMLFEGMMLAHVAQMASREEMLAVWEMGTYAGARIMGIEDTYGVAEGNNADLVVFDAPSAIGAFLDLAEKLYVFKDGNLLHSNRVTSESWI